MCLKKITITNYTTKWLSILFARLLDYICAPQWFTWCIDKPSLSIYTYTTTTTTCFEWSSVAGWAAMLDPPRKVVLLKCVCRLPNTNMGHHGNWWMVNQANGNENIGWIKRRENCYTLWYPLLYFASLVLLLHWLYGGNTIEFRPAYLFSLKWPTTIHYFTALLYNHHIWFHSTYNIQCVYNTRYPAQYS